VSALSVETLSDPTFVHALMACGAFALGCWLLSVVTREYSWVDRLWSIVPALYVGYFAYAGDFHPRLVLLAALTTAWGARLTFNFARKGGYARGGEDYRWEELKKGMSPALFQLFNLTFIASYQHLLLFLITLPAWVAIDGGPLNALDALAGIGFVGLLALETIADEQQWRFQEDKRKRREQDLPIEAPFLRTGLFRLSRHPNFFAEQGMWWCVYLFGVAATGRWLDATILGPVLLTVLFQGSTSFTEKISVRRYPSYADYQRVTSRLMPWPPRSS
jgi:steroid 5-alpha reductase family enzyme